MANSKKEVVIWGSGKIGRGFIADIFNSGGYHITFIDVCKELVASLRERRKYTIIKLPGVDEEEEVVVSNYEAYHTEEKEQISQKLMDCNTLAVVVFPNAFAQTACEITNAIEARALKEGSQPLNILLCANILHPAPQFRKFIEENLSENGKKYLDEKVGFIETVIMRIAIEPTQEMKEKDALVVLTNGYPEMPADKKAFKGDLPNCEMILYTENISAEETRKTYTYNMAHAVLSYIGSQKNYKYVADCIQDDEVREIVLNTLEEASQALQKEFGFSKIDMDIWNKRVIKDIANPILKDELKRVGGDPIRKLSKDDRLVGPALLCRKNGIMPYYLSKAIAGAFIFFNPEDKSCVTIKEYLAQKDIKTAIKHFCGLDKEVELIQVIKEQYEKAISGKGIKEDSARVNVIKNAYELGFKCELKYRGCAQAALAAFFDITGNTNHMLFQVATGLSGGMAIIGDGACGGYTGGIMFMGSYVGRRIENIPIDGDKIAQYKSYEMSQRLHDKYIETYGSVTCGNIHNEIFGRSYCLRTKEVRDAFELAGAHTTNCTTVIAIACAWIAEIMMDEQFIAAN